MKRDNDNDKERVSAEIIALCEQAENRTELCDAVLEYLRNLSSKNKWFPEYIYDDRTYRLTKGEPPLEYLRFIYCEKIILVDSMYSGNELRFLAIVNPDDLTEEAWEAIAAVSLPESSWDEQYWGYPQETKLILSEICR